MENELSTDKQMPAQIPAISIKQNNGIAINIELIAMNLTNEQDTRLLLRISE